MSDYCVLKIGEQTRGWRYDLPAFLSFIFDKDSFYTRSVENEKVSYKEVGYASTCSKALERLNKSGFDWRMMEKVYSSYYDELYENFAFELEYHISGEYDWDFATIEEYVEDYLGGLSQLSRLNQLKDFSAFYVPMLLADSGKKASVIKSMDGRPYKLKKNKYEKNYADSLERFSLDRYFGLPPWILLIAGLFTNSDNRNFDEVIAAMDIKFLLEWHPPGTDVNLSLSGLIRYDREIEGLHERLARRLVNKVNLYNNFLGSVIENDKTVRGIHLKTHVKEILDRIADRKISSYLKGKALEELMNHIFSAVNGFEVSESRVLLGDEEIDLLLKNNIDEPFWVAFNSPLIFVECKNWSKKAGTPEIRDFEGKLRNHSIVKIGFFISYMGFSAEVKTAIQRSSRDGNHIVLIGGTDLRELVESDIEVLAWLESLMIKLH